jgi:hypothetical protein
MIKPKRRVDPYVVRTGVSDMINIMLDAIEKEQDWSPTLKRFKVNFSDEEYTAICNEFARQWMEPEGWPKRQRR